MELLDRYLQAVKFWLPRAQQDDIIKELSENILSQMEDKESELGRPLTEAEQSAIIKQHGHPMMAASRYWPRQHLIGPALFPVYWFVLRIAVLFAVVVSLVSAIGVLAAGRPAQSVVDAFLSFPGVALTTFAWITAVFALLDYGQTKFKRLDKWDPASLPKVDKQKRARSNAKPITELICTAIFVIWWIFVPRFPFLIFGPAHSFLRISPAFESLHLTILLLFLVPAIPRLVNLLRPDLEWLPSFSDLATKIVNLAIISLLLKAGPLLVITPDAPGNLAQFNSAVNVYCTIGLTACSVVIVIQILMTVIGLIRGQHRLMHLTY